MLLLVVIKTQFQLIHYVCSVNEKVMICFGLFSFTKEGNMTEMQTKVKKNLS